MMRVAVLGQSTSANVRAKVLDGLRLSDGRAVISVAIDIDETQSPTGVAEAIPADVEVVFFSGSGGRDPRVLAELARRGVNLFLDWPAAASVHECRDLSELGEEAGVEIGVSRPLRFHPLIEEVAERHVEILIVRQHGDLHSGAAWKRALEDAVDLSLRLARGASPRRIDAALARTEARRPLLTAASIRFQSGTYAQIELHHNPGAADSMLLEIAGTAFGLSQDLGINRNDLLRRESLAFLEAVRANRPPPVSVLDALQTMRLVEKLLERLR